LALTFGAGYKRNQKSGAGVRPRKMAEEDIAGLSKLKLPVIKCSILTSIHSMVMKQNTE